MLRRGAWGLPPVRAAEGHLWTDDLRERGWRIKRGAEGGNVNSGVWASDERRGSGPPAAAAAPPPRWRRRRSRLGRPATPGTRRGRRTRAQSNPGLRGLPAPAGPAARMARAVRAPGAQAGNSAAGDTTAARRRARAAVKALRDHHRRTIAWLRVTWSLCLAGRAPDRPEGDLRARQWARRCWARCWCRCAAWRPSRGRRASMSRAAAAWSPGAWPAGGCSACAPPRPGGGRALGGVQRRVHNVCPAQPPVAAIRARGPPPTTPPRPLRPARRDEAAGDGEALAPASAAAAALLSAGARMAFSERLIVSAAPVPLPRGRLPPDGGAAAYPPSAAVPPAGGGGRGGEGEGGAGARARLGVVALRLEVGPLRVQQLHEQGLDTWRPGAGPALVWRCAAVRAWGCLLPRAGLPAGAPRGGARSLPPSGAVRAPARLQAPAGRGCRRGRGGGAAAGRRRRPALRQRARGSAALQARCAPRQSALCLNGFSRRSHDAHAC